MSATAGAAESPSAGASPAKAGIVLVSLILVAGVANLNLSVANVALPAIGQHFDSSQTTLDLIAVGYSLGLAASVLWLGALGDRYGRKLMLVCGMVLSVPACLLAAWAPSDTVLFLARVLGGFSAGMAYPTTLALITALWSGPGAHEVDRALVGDRRRARGARPARRRRPARALLVGLGLPGHAAARGGRARHGGHVRPEPRQRDDGAGRQPRRRSCSLVLVGALILSINFAPVPNKGTLTLVLAAIAAVALVGVLPPAAARAEPALRPATSHRGGRSGSRRAPGSSSSAR